MVDLPPINYFVTFFPFQTNRRPNLTLPLNRSRSTKGHHLYELLELLSPMLHAKFQDHRTSNYELEDF